MNNWVLYCIVGFLALDLIIVIFVFVKKSFKSISQKDLEFINNTWKSITKVVNENPTKAIMDSDKLLDHVLKIKGFSGSLADKLKVSKPLFTDINGVWNAHKLRNKVAHEMGDHNLKDVKYAIKSYERALKDLNVI